MRIKLNWMKLRNFKGQKELLIEPEGKDLNIFGRNGTGKTTAADAYYWLLFDKDSQGKSTFEIKTLNEYGHPMHRLEHEVEGSFDVDGKELLLKKVYYEKWQTKRGSTTETFNGHTADYYINDVPKKAGEYQDYIASIIDEDRFKLLTDPFYFNEKLDWKERRKILEEVFGGITDKEVIENNECYSKLAEILENRSIEEQERMLKAQKSKIAKRMKDIPARIDENDRGLPDIKGLDKKEIQEDIKALKGAKSEREKELAKVRNGGGVAEKEKELAELEKELMIIENDYTARYNENIKQKRDELSILNEAFDGVRRECTYKGGDIQDNERKIENLEDNKKELKDEWFKISDRKDELRKKEADVDNKCPTCNQDLPESEVQEAINKFNLDKAETIASLTNKQKLITEKGQAINCEIEKIKKENLELEKEIDSLDKKKKDYEQQVEEYKKEITDLQKKAEEYQGNFEYKKKLAQAESIEKAITKLQEGNQEEVQEIQKTIAQLEVKINEKEDKLKDIEEYNRKKKRIDELVTEQRKLAKEHEKLEGQLYLIEEFNRTKMDFLEDKVNDQFEIAEFKLFEEQINGGIKDSCECIVKGVPYSTGLNNGAKINAGVDIINKMSVHYDFFAPIFVDNAESVNEIIKSESQMIKLIVSEDEKLKMEAVNND